MSARGRDGHSLQCLCTVSCLAAACLPPVCTPLPTYLTWDVPGADLDREVDQLVLEARVFTMASHLMWALWSFPMSCASRPSEFSYVEYGQLRFREYLRLKAQFLADTVM